MVEVEVQRHTYPNGLVLLSERMPHIRSVSLGVWMRRGSRHETAEQNGICHFIEHLLFKGTESRSAQDIALIIDSVGGHMDAFTTKEYTCFYFRVLDEHVDIAVDLLTDIVRHPRFVPAEIEKERKVIFEEIRMVEDTPDELVYDLFSEAFYREHPLGRPIQGTIESVTGMQPEALTRFFRDAYQPGNLLITAAGNLDHDRLVSAMGEAFQKMSDGRQGGELSPPVSHAEVRLCEKKELGQLHLCLGVPGVPMNDERRYALYVMNTVLGGTMSSRLFQNIREQRGLAYAVFSTANSYADAGHVMVYAATSPSSAREVTDLVLQEFRRIKAEPVESGELQLAKDNLKGNLMLSLESSSSRMSNLARQEMYFGRQTSMDDVLASIDRVTAEELQRIAQQLLDRGKCAMAALGQTSGLRIEQTDLDF
jgi:predicted Zn-dependent peptidase